MHIERTSLEDLIEAVTLSFEPSDYAPRVERVLENYRKQAVIPGFRKGKAPMALVRKQYAAPVLADEMNKMIQEHLDAFIRDNGLQVLGQPLPSETHDSQGDFERPDRFEFGFEIGLAPNVPTDFGSKAVFTRHFIAIDKGTVDRQIEDHRRRHGTLSDVEVAGDKDLLLCHLEELGATGEPYEGGLTGDTSISLEHLEDAKAKKALTGLRVGEHADLNPHAITADHDELARILGIEHDAVHTLLTNFRVTVKEIKHLELHANNEELWNAVFPEAPCASEADFRKAVEAALQQQFEHDAEYVFRRRFVVDLIDHLNLPMPDRFLKRWILASNEQPLTEEQLDREYPAYSQSLRWELLQGAIMRDQDIRINREDIVEEAKDILRGQYEKYGLPVDDATLTGYAEEIFAKEDDRRRLIDRIVERHVVDALKEKVTIESKAVSFEEFGKLLASVR